MNYKSLVVGGSGSKGYASIGAIQQLCDKLSGINRYLGVSSGSIVATLLAIGCSPEELKKYYDMVDLEKFKTKYSSIYTYYKLLTKRGIHDSSVFRETIVKNMLEEKTGNGDITFKEIYEKYGNILVIPSACINRREMYYYHHISNPNMQVKFAIERSCCVPVIFQPIFHKGDTLVDAGIIDNYPLYFFDKEDTMPNSRLKLVVPDLSKPVSNKTLGILIIDDNTSKSETDPYLGDDKTNTIMSYMMSILNTLLTTNSRAHIGRGYWENTIAINIGRNIDGVTTMKLDDKTKEDFYRKGQEAGDTFLKNLLD